MRLVQYLSEGTIEADILKLRDECSDFLKEVGDSVRLWRGTNRRMFQGVERLVSRSDRHPKDTPPEIHDILDDLFSKRFGWKVRSSGVFVSNSMVQAMEFGSNAYRFFPVNGYKYVYNQQIYDLTGYMKYDMGILDSKMGNFFVNHKLSKGELNRRLENIVSSYKDKNIPTQVHDGMELSFYCPKGYYLVNDEVLKNYYSLLFKGV